ncbi:MAG: hypothetical protein ABSD85_07760 [Acidimicrobiales bacterium]
MSHAYSLRAAEQPSRSVSRPYRTIVLTLMVATSTIAVFDLYLFASSGFH